jgi:hypothetical protein
MAFHLPSSEFPLILGPVAPSSVHYTLPFELIIFPLAVIFYCSVRIIQGSVAMHFVSMPIAVEIAPVCVDVFAFPVALVLFVFLPFISIAVRIQFVDLLQVGSCDWPELAGEGGLCS